MDFSVATQTLSPLDDVTSYQNDSSVPIGYLHFLGSAQFLSKTFPIYYGDNLIGRARDARVFIPSRHLSRKHACISHMANTTFIYDCGSHNKTFRREFQLYPEIRYEITDGIALKMGDLEFKYTTVRDISLKEGESIPPKLSEKSDTGPLVTTSDATSVPLLKKDSKSFSIDLVYSSDEEIPRPFAKKRSNEAKILDINSPVLMTSPPLTNNIRFSYDDATVRSDNSSGFSEDHSSKVKQSLKNNTMTSPELYDTIPMDFTLSVANSHPTENKNNVGLINDRLAVTNDTLVVISGDTLAVTNGTLAVTSDTLAVTNDTLAVKSDTLAVTNDTLAVTSGDTLAVTNDTLAVKSDTASVTKVTRKKGRNKKMEMIKSQELENTSCNETENSLDTTQINDSSSVTRSRSRRLTPKLVKKETSPIKDMPPLSISPSLPTIRLEKLPTYMLTASQSIDMSAGRVLAEETILPIDDSFYRKPVRADIEDIIIMETVPDNDYNMDYATIPVDDTKISRNPSNIESYNSESGQINSLEFELFGEGVNNASLPPADARHQLDERIFNDSPNSYTSETVTTLKHAAATDETAPPIKNKPFPEAVVPFPSDSVNSVPEAIGSNKSDSSNSLPEVTVPYQMHKNDSLPEATVPYHYDDVNSPPEATIPYQMYKEAPLPEVTIAYKILKGASFTEATVPYQIHKNASLSEATVPYHYDDVNSPPEAIGSNKSDSNNSLPEATVPYHYDSIDSLPEATVPYHYDSIDLLPEATVPYQMNKDASLPKVTLDASLTEAIVPYQLNRDASLSVPNSLEINAPVSTLPYPLEVSKVVSFDDDLRSPTLNKEPRLTFSQVSTLDNSDDVMNNVTTLTENLLNDDNLTTPNHNSTKSINSSYLHSSKLNKKNDRFLTKQEILSTPFKYNDTDESTTSSNFAKKSLETEESPITLKIDDGTSELDCMAMSPTQEEMDITLNIPHVMFTYVQESIYKSIVSKLGGCPEQDVQNATHLVTDKVRRTVKFLCCLARGCQIVSIDWLIASKAAKSFLDPISYFIKDKASEKQYKYKLIDSHKSAQNAKLFKHKQFHITKNVKPTPKEMTAIIRCSGGSVLNNLPPIFNPNLIIITCEEDSSLINNSVFTESDKIYSNEYILTGVLRQECSEEFKMNILGVKRGGSKRNRSTSGFIDVKKLKKT